MDQVDRRSFMKSVAGAATLAAADTRGATPAVSDVVFLSTWIQGRNANSRAVEVLKGGGSLLDAVEKGINTAEDDPSISSVGYGGLPNADGVVELDAAIMDGTRHRAGAVCSLHDIKNPISVARMVLEKTRHTTLAGEGAFRFALKMGFQPQQLLTPESLRKWLDWKADPKRTTFWKQENHDTIGMVAIDGKGHVVSGCSTSGLAWKIPGRVGDSPLVGCGVYADDHAGAASATGDGDLMTNYCTSVSIVHIMARGAKPQEACVELLEHMARTDPASKEAEVCVIAINTRGEAGAASMQKGFRLKYALTRGGEETFNESPVVF
ncbi:MAG: N(4)-(beta-N-acetylglucosaminyl)-L-asparaginase [Terriglobia bacterium]